jgi:hypothetical protein
MEQYIESILPAWRGAKFSTMTNISMYCKSLSDLNDSYGSLNKRIYGQQNMTKIIMKLHNK